MKKFAGTRDLNSIKDDIAEREGWEILTDKYDAGSDWVTIYGDFAGNWINVIFCPYNGNFIIKMPNGDIASERSVEIDDVDWYVAVMDFLYIPEDAAATAEAAE